MKVKFLIIGGGLSGLAFANQAKGEDYYIVERESSLGGLCRTHYVDDYIWDYAGHFFHFANPEIKQFFESKMTDESFVKCEKNTKIYYKGKFIDYPFQKNIHQLDKEEFIECLYFLFNRPIKEKYSDYLQMLYGKFGKGITEKFLKPYNEKLYACELEELDTEAMGRFFPYADIQDIINNMYEKNNNSYNTIFDYPKNGAQEIINLLLDNVESDKIVLNTSVTDIDIENKIAHLSNGNPVQYDYLINTIPFNKFIDLYNSCVDKTKLSANQVLVFNLGFDAKTNNREIHWIYYPSSELCFYRVGFYDNILKQDRGSLYVEIGLDENVNIDEKIVQESLKNILRDLNIVGVITNQKLVAWEALVINPGYVHVTENGKKTVENEIKKLGTCDIYTIGRYGKWTYCSMEDCIIQAINTHREIREKNDSI